MPSNLFSYIASSKLQNRFLSFVIVLSSIPLLVLGGVTLYFIDLSHRYDVSNLELQLIDQKIEEIEKFFADTLGLLELRVGFTQKSEIELSQQLFLLEGLLEENRAFEKVSFINLEGKETTKKARFEEDDELSDVSLLQKFLVPRKGEQFIDAVYYTLSGPFITLAAPVRNRNDDIIQILSAEVNLSQIIRSIETARVGTAGYMMLLDRGGALMAARAPGNLRPGFNLAGLERVARMMRGEILDGLDPRDRYESIFGSLPVVGAGKKIMDIHWLLMVEWPLVDADTIIRDVRNQVLIFTLFSLIAIIFLAPFFTARLLKPLHALKESARDIEKGNFDMRVEITTKDELEELGNAFNTMAQGLKRLQELKNEFVFIAAHELRTPAAVIKGYLSMILDGTAGAVNAKMKEYITTAQESNERLIQLVNDILEIARSEAGRLKIEVRPHDLRESIKTILTEVKPLADEKHIILSYDELPNLPHVFAEPTRVKEVIMNFISNAIKYNREGGSVKIYHELKDGFVFTHVKDNGFGIPEEEQKRVFEKFFRSGTVEVRNIQGTGLGLFIVKELVEKMGGKVWFVSQEGTGSTFSFSLRVT